MLVDTEIPLIEILGIGAYNVQDGSGTVVPKNPYDGDCART